MRRLRMIGVLLVLVMVTAGCSGGDGAETEAAGEGAGAADSRGAGAERQALADEQAEGGEASGDAGSQALPLSAAASGERVIKDGNVTVEVEKRRFDAAFAQVVETAAQLGGSVAASSTHTEPDDGGTSGTVTVRVPVDRYEELLTAVAAIGDVRDRSITTRDVTSEFIDLEARQRQLQAQERFYLELLERAEGVRDAIAVQQQLADLQVELERIQGRLQFLEDRTTFSTLTIELFERGVLLPVEEPLLGPSLARYWQMAQEAFVTVVGLLLVLATVLTPVLVLAVLVLGGRRLWQHRGLTASQ